MTMLAPDRSFFLSALLTVGALLSTHSASANTPHTCYSSYFDRDGDGYASPAAGIGTLLGDVELHCGSGYVDQAGDCDDNDASKHPRRHEIAANGWDDDCDGRYDEPEPVYPPNPWYTTVPHGFTMKVHINNLERQLFQQGFLYAQVSYRVMENYDEQVLTPLTKVTTLAADDTYLASVGNVQTESPVEAQVHFAYVSPQWSQEYSVSDPYYVMLDPPTRSNSDMARYYLVNRAFHEADLSSHGHVGYRGTDAADGEKYGASWDEKWCSEFYAWVTAANLTGIAGSTDTGDIIDYFQDHHTLSYRVGAWIGYPAGSYLAIKYPNGDIHHSAMVLGYNRHNGELWTLEGNSGNEVKVSHSRHLTDNTLAAIGFIRDGWSHY